jgi:thioredoxin-dependent peroxiredoxin
VDILGAMVAEGTPAPDFELLSDSGDLVRLSSLRGQPVVLYFYPKDDTPGCTRQACGIRDAWASFEERGAVVLGVSPDGEGSHADFKSKFSLPFTLLADPDHAVADAYGVWIERTLNGLPAWGNQRSTFVIDADGVLTAVMREVDPDQHAADVLAALDGSSGSRPR